MECYCSYCSDSARRTDFSNFRIKNLKFCPTFFKKITFKIKIGHFANIQVKLLSYEHNIAELKFANKQI